jgi:hypothetical protein
MAQEPEGSSPHSQQLATGPYPEPVEPNPHLLPQPVSLRSVLIPSSHLRLDRPSGHSPSGLPTKTLYTFMEGNWNIWDKQSRAADSGWPSSLGVGRGLTTPHRKIKVCYESLHAASDQDGLFGTTQIK